MSRIDELTRNDILKDVESKVKKRAKVLHIPRYLGVTRDYVVHMEVDSSTGNGSYVVRIKLDEYPSIESDATLTTEEKVRLSLAGDIKLHCTCPAFRYWGYEYITTQLDANSHTNQYLYPSVRNPNLEGTLCKHCYRAVRSFGSYWKLIAKDIDNMNFIEER